MATLAELANLRTTLEEPAIDHLLRLTASWSLLADLSFSDMLMMARVHAEQKAILEKQARAAAEDRAKQEAVARVMQEHQARQRAEQEIATKVAAELRAREQAERDADLRARQEAQQRAEATAAQRALEHDKAAAKGITVAAARKRTKSLRLGLRATNNVWLGTIRKELRM